MAYLLDDDNDQKNNFALLFEMEFQVMLRIKKKSYNYNPL